MSRSRFKRVWKAVVSLVIERELVVSAIRSVWIWYALKHVLPTVEISFWTFVIFVPVIGFGVGMLLSKLHADYDIKLQEILRSLEEPQ